MGLADAQMDLVGEMTEKLRENIDEVPARDLPGGIRNVTTAAAVHTDKAQILTGEPTEIVGKQSAAEILRSLAAKGVLSVPVDADATEEPMDQLPEGEEKAA